MAHQALYRRFRPKTFDYVLGQEHITTTLKNQIISNNIAHAYLFSGTRGTGKTSTAKILSRAVNCLNNEDGNPCNECEVCKGILDDSIMDVVEMDAASNNSVDDVRELREKAKYPPSKCRYKVYIIDEVHMLSKGAFNALLKTLEEPPKHLIFVLATTEPQKLPATILSRCQRFDFKRITVNDIVKNMNTICDEIGINIEEKALQLIGRNSDGAMRDALSILDQCISFAEDEITYEYVLSILGIVNNDLIFEITDSIIGNKADKSLELVDTIVQNGKDIHQFIKDLISHFRNLMIVKTSNYVENIIDGSEELISQLKEQAQKIELNSIITFLSILSDAENQSKWSSQPRIILEVSIIKMMNTPSVAAIDVLWQKINELEEKLENGAVIAKQTKSISNTKSENKSIRIEKEDIVTQVNDNPKKEVPDYSNKASVLSDISINKIKADWENILKRIKSEKISLHALIMEGKPTSFKNNVLSIAFGEGFGFHKDAIEKPDNKGFIQNIISSYLNANIEIKFIMDIDVSEKEDEKEGQALVDKAISIFGEDLVEIEQ
ncbi:DNA polymerase III subunit gamma/tau [Brassicibacter mesophilus]|uniref:DNA polymerase III subunit gamma/tau n=1 Tax=Brassicibacter mesophilus TaxID=745119 RepID=UPI003D1C6593